jgi:hypothetical protein
MARLYDVPGTGEPSDVSFDGIRYELTHDDWRSQFAREHDGHWSRLRQAASRVSKAVKLRT